MNNDDVNCYYALCSKGCGGISFAAVDDPKWAKDTAKSVAEVIKSGRTVKTATVTQIREMPWCNCKSKP